MQLSPMKNWLIDAGPSRLQPEDGWARGSLHVHSSAKWALQFRCPSLSMSSGLGKGDSEKYPVKRWLKFSTALFLMRLHSILVIRNSVGGDIGHAGMWELPFSKRFDLAFATGWEKPLSRHRDGMVSGQI